MTTNSSKRQEVSQAENETSQSDDLLICLHCYAEHETTDCIKLRDLGEYAQLCFIKENDVCEKFLGYHIGEIAGEHCEISNRGKICRKCETHHHLTIRCKAVNPSVVQSYYADPHLFR